MDLLELVHDYSTARHFACTYRKCVKAFSRRSDLVRHMRIHTNERPFACSWPGCKRDFIQRSALTVHFRVHTGERPHHCEVKGCDKAFSDSSSLARHRRIHTGNRPYQCHVKSCMKTFCRKMTLTKHIKRNHAEEMYEDGVVDYTPSPDSSPRSYDEYQDGQLYYPSPQLEYIRHGSSASTQWSSTDQHYPSSSSETYMSPAPSLCTDPHCHLGGHLQYLPPLPQEQHQGLQQHQQYTQPEVQYYHPDPSTIYVDNTAAYATATPLTLVPSQYIHQTEVAHYPQPMSGLLRRANSTSAIETLPTLSTIGLGLTISPGANDHYLLDVDASARMERRATSAGLYDPQHNMRMREDSPLISGREDSHTHGFSALINQQIECLEDQHVQSF